MVKGWFVTCEDADRHPIRGLKSYGKLIDLPELPAIPAKDDNVQIPVEPPMPHKYPCLTDVYVATDNSIIDRLTWYERQTDEKIEQLVRITDKLERWKQLADLSLKRVCDIVNDLDTRFEQKKG